MSPQAKPGRNVRRAAKTAWTGIKDGVGFCTGAQKGEEMVSRGGAGGALRRDERLRQEEEI